ncbi:MAG: recombinase family protein [Alphaproteobacteria bacterium]|nr:recombinase family protein [Alphaproteobacteria bacterium]
MPVIAYIRKSTDRQSFEHQEYEIEQYAEKHNLKIDRWVEENISSRKELKKRQLGKLLEELQDGDILIATEISRLGRSLLEVMGILQTCLEKNCQVWTIKESYNLKNDLQSQLLAAVFTIGVSIERSLLSQRTKTALDAKKAAGVKLGRPFGAESKKLKLSKNTKRIRDLLDKKVSKNQIARIMGVQKITLRRFIKRMGWND